MRLRHFVLHDPIEDVEDDVNNHYRDSDATNDQPIFKSNLPEPDQKRQLKPEAKLTPMKLKYSRLNTELSKTNMNKSMENHLHQTQPLLSFITKLHIEQSLEANLN